MLRKKNLNRKRLLRFLDTPFPCQVVMRAWLVYVAQHLWHSKREKQQALVLIDETDLPEGWKALVASLPFRHRAIPIYWCIYKNKEISDGTYRSHNEIIQNFCVDLHQQILQSSKCIEPVYVFDRGFARARYVIKFLDDRGINVLMRVPRNVSVRVAGRQRKLDDLEVGGYADVYFTRRPKPFSLTFMSSETKHTMTRCI